jgi:hypothetical protein
MRRFASLAFALAVIASPLAAQGAHPNFGGKWTLDPAGSPASPMMPSAMTVTVTQDDKTINVESVATTPMGDQKTTQLINLDGSSTTNTINGGGTDVVLTSTAAWDGAALVVTTKAEVQGQPLQQTDRWSLDPDGKTLSMARGLNIAGQSMDMKLVFKKS